MCAPVRARPSPCASDPLWTRAPHRGSSFLAQKGANEGADGEEEGPEEGQPSRAP